MRKIILLLLAVLPFGMGYLLNYIIIKFDWCGSSIISLLYFFYWFYVGRISVKYTKSAVESIIIGHSFAIITIVLIVFQEIFLGRYLPNLIGFSSQMFFLPALSLTSTFSNWLLMNAIWEICILTFFIMILVYYLGYKSNRD